MLAFSRVVFTLLYDILLELAQHLLAASYLIVHNFHRCRDMMLAILPILLLASATFAPLTVASATANADYIVVGGGTGGCALAARLCVGLPHASVTLLERGKERNSEEVRIAPK